MVAFFGRGSIARGYQLTMGSFLALSIVLFLIAFSVSKERIQPPPQQKTSVGRDLADLMKNGPWIALFLTTVFYFTALLIRNNPMIAYFENCAGNRNRLGPLQRLGSGQWKCLRRGPRFEDLLFRPEGKIGRRIIL